MAVHRLSRAQSPVFITNLPYWSTIYNNNNNISLLQTHGPYTYKKKMLNIYKNSNKNNNNIISQSKIVLINITLISTIAEWESEYKQ